MVEQQKTEATSSLDGDVGRMLVENHRQFLGFLERRVGRRDVAEDILQEAFARSFDKLEMLRDDEAVISWFYRTLRNATVDYFRRTKARDRALTQFADELECAEQPTETMREEVCRCVTRVADSLKSEYADALRRIEVDGISVASFAEERGISRSNAAVRVFRARQALRRQLALSCGTCAKHGCVSCTCADGGPTRLSPDRARDE